VAKQMFIEVVTEILKSSTGMMNIDEIAVQMNSRCYRKIRGKQKGQQVDARYVAWGAVVHPDEFEVLVKLKK
jgi:hypothetical protein